MKVHVVATDWNRHGQLLRRLREIVFIEEQGVARDEEWDGEDENARHFIALNSAGQALGTARLLATGQIGRMAVLPEYRKAGLGRRLLDAAVDAARRQGMEEVFLHAQTHALPFYKKAGFDPIGEEFMEAGIPHQAMRLLLPVVFAETPEARALDIHNPSGPDADAGRESKVIVFDHDTACRDALLSVLAAARRELIIVSPTLDRALFGAPEAVESISNYVRRTAQPVVRILVEDARAIAGGGHPLLELARRLPSKVHMRRQPPDIPEGTPAHFVVADTTSLWVVQDRDVLSGFANLHDRVEARRLLDVFNHLYDRAQEDPELRRLDL
jgi:predicted GNAT family N-acyltransferase